MRQRHWMGTVWPWWADLRGISGLLWWIGKNSGRLSTHSCVFVCFIMCWPLACLWLWLQPLNHLSLPLTSQSRELSDCRQQELRDFWNGMKAFKETWFPPKDCGRQVHRLSSESLVFVFCCFFYCCLQMFGTVSETFQAFINKYSQKVFSEITMSASIVLIQYFRYVCSTIYQYHPWQRWNNPIIQKDILVLSCWHRQLLLSRWSCQLVFMSSLCLWSYFRSL